jgi:hypothetical protein
MERVQYRPGEQSDTDFRFRCWQPHDQEDAIKASLNRARVMTEAEEFRRYAEEALQWASKSKDETEKKNLTDLACTLATAAFAGQLKLVGLNAVSRAAE